MKISLGETGREVAEGEEKGRDRKRGLRRERKSEIKEELGRCRKRVYRRGRMGEIKEELRREVKEGEERWR